MPTSGTRRVNVGLGSRSYDVLIGRGLALDAGRHVAALAPGRAVAIVTDERVAALHLAAIRANLAEAGARTTDIIVPAGEQTKSLEWFGHVADALLEARLERGDLVVALGGGVVGDLAGFVAGVVRRGMRVVQIPTTLLAQVDSSVGGKTAINARQGKNLIGVFHQPSLVLCDTALLDTLPEREMRAGYAELVKYGLLGDRALFDWLEGGAWREVLSGGPAREAAVEAACRAKAGVVARDETETGERALLNLGHTFGHAIEALAGYDGARVIHGEAVAIGMAMAFRFSRRLDLCTGQDSLRAERHLQAVGLPTTPAAVPGGTGDAAAWLNAIRQDKKVAAGALTFILARGIGEAFVAKDVPAREVEAFIAEDLSDALAAEPLRP